MYPEMYDFKTDCDIIGTTQSGKSKMVEACCREHFENGNVAVLDWHGTLYQNLVHYLAYRQPHRKIVLVNPSEADPKKQFVIPWNPFRFTGGDPSAHASRLVTTLGKLWGMENTNEMPNFRRIAQMLFTYVAVSGEPLGNAAILLDYENRALRNTAIHALEAQRNAQRELENLQLISAKASTVSAFKEWQWNVGSTVNRLGKLLDSRAIMRMTGLNGVPSLDINMATRENAIILVNLAPSAELDPESAATLAALFLAEFQRVALAHATEERPYFLYCDECQNYLTSDAARMLDQTVKTGLRVTLIHHDMGQFHDNEILKSAIRTNAGIKAVFRMNDPEQATQSAQELFMGELNQEKIRRERTRFVTEHEWEDYDSCDEHSSSSEGFSEGEYSSSSTGSYTSGITVHHGGHFVPNLIELPDAPEVWGRDEKLGQLAERLMTLEDGCCYIKTPDGTESHEVPYVRDYWTNPDTVLEFMQTANTLAISPDEADRIIQQQERTFLEGSNDAGVRPKKRPARLHPQE